MEAGDIYRWQYNQATLEKKAHCNNSGTTYWCCSNIGIWNESKGLLIDTYWGSYGDSTNFNSKGIADLLDLTFIANINDLTPVRNKGEFNNYDDDDCINISHANMSSGGFYIKTGAKPSVNKKRKVLAAYIEHEKFRVDWHKRQLDRFEKDLQNLTEDSYVPYNPKVYIE